MPFLKKVSNFNDIKHLKTNNSNMSNIKDQNISIEDDVKNKLDGKEMELTMLFRKYFKDELEQVDSQDDEDDEFAEDIHPHHLSH